MPDLSHLIPLLPWSEILETLESMRLTPEQLREMGLESRTLLPPLSLEQLEHPTPDFVRRVLSFLIEEILTVSGCGLSLCAFPRAQNRCSDLLQLAKLAALSHHEALAAAVQGTPLAISFFKYSDVHLSAPLHDPTAVSL